jgi:uncharacterized protein (UPF0332 family)
MTSPQPFNWLDYLELAQALAKRTEESYLRMSVSRAYYHIYHLALSRAKANGYEPLRGEPRHSQLWRIYNKNANPECVRLGQIALRLQKNRERADYENVFVRIKDEAQQALVEAQDFARRLAILPARMPNPKAVREYVTGRNLPFLSGSFPSH